MEQPKRGPKAAYGGQGGFTLLEVLVAVAILSISLSSLLWSQINSLRATRYARGVTAAAFLAEYQLTEIEWQQINDGWQQSDIEYEGTFDDEGWPDVSYQCLVDFIELPEYNQMLEAKTDADNALGDDAAYADAGDQAFSALGLVWPIVKQAIENSIRKASCTVLWTDGKIEHEFEVQTFWADPERLKEIPALGGEFTQDDDESGEGEEGAPQTGGGSSRPGPGGTPQVGGGGGLGGPGK